ncbi:MAG: putative Mg(2+) transport ATPase [Bryobacterales bacterium]|nr:putative Mg(2+) transport ATPase [Bryobacterales bacterium]
MHWMDFGIRMVAALLLGGVIGLERQWRQRMTGLRTNALVAVGSAMFVMMGGLIAGDGSQGRVAAYVVSGIGFLGGGVILKDGFNIRGLNTAATLWCTAAVGTLAGLGRMELAAMGAAGVLSANLILRPVAYLVNRTPVLKEEHEILYRLRCTCRTADEANFRTILIQNVGRSQLSLIALQSVDDELLARVNVKAYLKTLGPKEQGLEQIVTRLSLEAGVSAISWEVVAAVDAEDATLSASEELIHES